MSTREEAAAALLDRLGEVVLELDLGDDPPRVVQGNRTALELLGVRADDATRALLAAFHPDDRLVFDGQCALARSGVARSADCRVIDASGEIRWLRGSMRPDTRAATTAHYVALGVTEERRLLAGLARVADARPTPRTVDDGAFVFELVDDRLRIVLADATLRHLAGLGDPTGLDPATAIGPFLHPDDADDFADWLRRLARREAATVRYRVGVRGERPHTIVAAGMPRRLAGGRALICGLALETPVGAGPDDPPGALLAPRDYLRAWEHAADGRVVTRLADGGWLDEGVVSDLTAARADAPARSGRPVPPDAAAAPVALTGRQREVLALLCNGLSARQISRELQLSERTVGNHMNAILRRLDVHSRSEAVAKAFRVGLA